MLVSVVIAVYLLAFGADWLNGRSVDYQVDSDCGRYIARYWLIFLISSGVLGVVSWAFSGEVGVAVAVSVVNFGLVLFWNLRFGGSGKVRIPFSSSIYYSFSGKVDTRSIWQPAVSRAGNRDWFGNRE